MEVQQRTLDTIDTVDRLLNSYASSTFGSHTAPLPVSAASVTRSAPAGKSTTTTQTDASVSVSKSVQTCSSTRTAATEPIATPVKSVGTQTEEDDRLSVLAESLVQVVEAASQQLDSQFQCMSDGLDEMEHRLAPLPSRLEQCSQQSANQRTTIAHASYSELAANEYAGRSQIDAIQLDIRVAMLSQFYQLLIHAYAQEKREPQPQLHLGSPPHAATSAENTNVIDPMALLLDECIHALEDDDF